MRTTLALFTALAVTLLAPTGCEVVLTGSARITNDIAWTMTEVRIGKSVEDALAQPSLGSLAAGASMVVLDLSETFRWTVVALDADGQHYVDANNFVSSGIETAISLTELDFDAELTASQNAPPVVPTTGSAEIINDIIWDDGLTDLVAVHMGSSVEDALLTPSLGGITAGAALVVEGLDTSTTWTVVAIDFGGLYYVNSGHPISASTTRTITLTEFDYDEVTTTLYGGGIIEPTTGSAEIINDIIWAEGATDLAAVYIGTSVEDAIAQGSMGVLDYGEALIVEGLDTSMDWTIVGVDYGGLYYVSPYFEVWATDINLIALTEDDYDDAVTLLYGGGVVEPTPEYGSIVVTNDLDWAGVYPDFAATDITGVDYWTTIDHPGTEQGFSVDDVPVGDYTVTVTDNYGVEYIVSPVPVAANSDSSVAITISYATTGAINLTNMIDNLDNDEVFVVGLFTSPPDGATVDLGDNMLPLNTMLAYDESVVALGVVSASYHIIVADWDDNYYLIPDVWVSSGAVTDVQVTKEDRDEELTLALN